MKYEIECNVSHENGHVWFETTDLVCGRSGLGTSCWAVITGMPGSSTFVRTKEPKFDFKVKDDVRNYFCFDSL